jgi:hypothetical protein
MSSIKISTKVSGGSVCCSGGGTCPDLIGTPPFGDPALRDRRYNTKLPHYQSALKILSSW